MSESSNLPVVPLRNAVLFPGVSFPISAGRAATLRAIEAALSTPGRQVFAVAQRADTEDVHASELHAIGTIAAIGSVQRGLGGIRLVLEGKARGIALRYANDKKGFLEATVQEAHDMLPLDPKDAAFQGLHGLTQGRADGHARIQGSAGVLEDDLVSPPDLPPSGGQPVLQVPTVEPDLALLVNHQAAQDAHQRGLARARLPNHAHGGSPLDVQVKSFQRPRSFAAEPGDGVPEMKPADLNEGHRRLLGARWRPRPPRSSGSDSST